MNTAEAKLRRGLELLGKAGNDPDSLGLALLALHGALEDDLHARLREHPDLTEPDRIDLARGKLGWPERAAMAQRYRLIDQDEYADLLEAESVRATFAQGGAMAWERAVLRNYARLVVRLCQQEGLLLLMNSPQPAAAGPEAHPAQSNPMAALIEQGRRWLAVTGFPLGLAGWLAAGMLALLLLVSLVAGEPGSITTAGTGRATLPSVMASPPPTPAPAARSAGLVRLNGAQGRLHEAPGFDTVQLSIALNEGDQVTLLDGPREDVSGILWRQVAFGNYVGWVPNTNLEQTR
jgi:hypothetical protein